MRLAHLIEDLAGDFRYAGRWLRRSPAFTFVAVFTLAIGLGANTALFSIVDQLLLAPLPYRSPEQIVRIYEENALANFRQFSVTPATFLSWREQTTSFEDMAFFVGAQRNVVDEHGPDIMFGVAVSTNLLSMLGVQPILGRTFQEGDDREGTDPVVILSHDVWRARYGSAPDVIGRVVRMDGQARTIIGVLPPSSVFLSTRESKASSFLIPRILSQQEQGMRGNHFLSAIGRLKPGVTADQAGAEMQKIAEKLEQEFPNSNLGWRVRLMDLRQSLNGNTTTPSLMLLGASGLVLLIGCVNVTSLLLARSSTRQSELSIRFAIGASRGRIARQLAVEYLLLASLGGFAGLLFAAWGKDLVLAVAPTDVFNQVQSSLNVRVLLFASGITLVTTLLFGLVPGWRMWRNLAEEHLNQGARLVSAHHRVGAAQSRLIILETAFAAILLFGGAVLTASFMRLLSVPTGFDAGHVPAFRIRLATPLYQDVARRTQVYDQILERVRALPGVVETGAATNAPFTGGDQIFSLRSPRESKRLISANYYSASSGYFSAMRIPLKKGRLFTSSDTADTRPLVTIISEDLARSLFGNTDPIGREVFGFGNLPRVVVGVVGDTRHYGLDGMSRGQAYQPYTQNTQGNMVFVAKSSIRAESIAASVRKVVAEIDPELPAAEMRLMEDHVSASMSPTRFLMALSGLFAILALALAGVGIYGVLGFFVAERTPEVGLRMALGATARDIVKLVVLEGVRPVAFGLGLAVAVSAATFRYMDRLVFQPKNADAWLLVAVSAVVLIVAVLATYIPARRAARIEPMSALRSE